VRFAEFSPGQVIEAGPYVLGEEEILAFAKQYDPQWFHTDPEAAAEGLFGGLIASGWQTCAIAMRLVTQAALAGSESFASPGLRYVKWPNPVRPGDALRLRAVVLSARRSASKKTLGILEWQWVLHNQREMPVLDLVATSLFRLDAA